MPSIYSRSRRVVQRKVNPAVLAQPQAKPLPKPLPEPKAAPSTDMSLAELKGLAAEAGVPDYGTKADIVERLNG